ncbi:DUF6461 domain-containing protein [Parafrankia discariae]|uniref:DUF6461 domain-containing protein n=1 Tax=Parafrankia discariae TaxID=365528 RepID=UPI0003AA091C|nr:DUF6461 domain-containing protein [Parafrankia discariae]
MFRPDLESRQISLPEQTVELPADLLDPLAHVVAEVFPQLVAHIPPTPAAELGRLGVAGALPAALPLPAAAGGPVLTALRSAGPCLPERLLGALELAVDELPLRAPRGLARFLVDARPGAPLGGNGTRASAAAAGESEAVQAVALLDELHPGVSDLIHGYLRALVGHPAVAPLLAADHPAGADGPLGGAPFEGDAPFEGGGPDDSRLGDTTLDDTTLDGATLGGSLFGPPDELADEPTLAARHGAAHLALAVTVAAAVLRELDPPMIGTGAPGIVGTAVGSAALVLPSRPMPPAYPAALLTRRRAEYRLPRQAAGCVTVDGNCFGLVEGELPNPPSFARNGLVEAVAGGVLVRTGVGTGRVRVSLRVLATPPVPPAPADAVRWDEIVDVSWTAANGAAAATGAHTRVGSGTGAGAAGTAAGTGAGGPAGAGPATELAHLTTPPWPGDYRLRVHARGRDGAGEDETYDLVVWSAPAAPETVHRRTDQLGHRLRGEELPPVVTLPETRYRWVRRRSAFREAATFTVVVGASAEDVVRCFDADPGAPCSLSRLRDDRRTDPYVLVLPLDGDDRAVLAVEDNGFQGSRHPVLSAVSRHGLAASMFWNINALTRLSLARDGEVLAAFEPGPDAVPDAVVPLLRDVDLAGATDRVAKGLVVVERFTGHPILPEQLDRIVDNDVAYLINQH